MNNDYTDITILLDRSGSMGTIKEATIEGINSFIRDQQKVSGKCTLSLIQFDDRYEVNYIAAPIHSAAYLNDKTYEPRGMTALRDALSRSIDETGSRLDALPESDRPAKVIFVVITDGQENSSYNTSQRDVAGKVKVQEETYKWKFVFMGANIDTFATAGSYGVANVKGMACNFAATNEGVMRGMNTLSTNMTSYRSADLSVVNNAAGYTFWDDKNKVGNKEE